LLALEFGYLIPDFAKDNGGSGGDFGTKDAKAFWLAQFGARFDF
jgi:hypothetical protein